MSGNSGNNGPVLLFKNIKAWKLFPVIYCYGCQGWTWMKLKTNWANFFKFSSYAESQESSDHLYQFPLLSHHFAFFALSEK